MTLVEFCCGGRDNPFGQTGRKILDTLAPNSPRHLRLPIIIAATNAPLVLSTVRKRGNTKGESSLERFSDKWQSPPLCGNSRLKQSPNRHIAPTQITIVQPDGWLLGCGECNQLPTKKTITLTTAVMTCQRTRHAFMHSRLHNGCLFLKK